MGLRQPIVGTCLSFPVKFTRIDDKTTDSCSMSTDKLSRRMNYDIYTMGDNIDEIWSPKSIVSNQWNLMAVSNFSNLFKIRNVDKRITQRLNQDKFGIIFDSSFNFFRIVNIYKSCCDTIAWKSFF